MGDASAVRLTQHVGQGWGDDSKARDREDRELKQPAKTPFARCPRTAAGRGASVAHRAHRARAGRPAVLSTPGLTATVQSQGDYARVWRPLAAASPRTVQRSPWPAPYDLRHAAVSPWLNAGVPATQVAEWAGHSVHVLLKVYAKCIEGQDEAARRRIDEALKFAVKSTAGS